VIAHIGPREWPKAVGNRRVKVPLGLSSEVSHELLLRQKARMPHKSTHNALFKAKPALTALPQNSMGNSLSRVAATYL
jgi:hypothetical protein